MSDATILVINQSGKKENRKRQKKEKKRQKGQREREREENKLRTALQGTTEDKKWLLKYNNNTNRPHYKIGIIDRISVSKVNVIMM